MPELKQKVYVFNDASALSEAVDILWELESLHGIKHSRVAFLAFADTPFVIVLPDIVPEIAQKFDQLKGFFKIEYVEALSLSANN